MGEWDTRSIGGFFRIIWYNEMIRKKTTKQRSSSRKEKFSRKRPIPAPSVKDNHVEKGRGF